MFECQKTWYSHPYFSATSFQDTEDFNTYYIFLCFRSLHFSSPVRNPNSPALACTWIPMQTLHILSHNSRILIPTMIRSSHFSFITLIACAGSPIPEILVLLCDIDLLHIFLSSWNFINKAYCSFYHVVLSKMWHWQSEGRQITQHASY